MTHCMYLRCVALLLAATGSCALTAAELPVASAAPARLHLPPPPARVRVVRKSAETSYLRIPSPGHHYDDLLFNVKIGSNRGRHYLHAELRLSPELDDVVTLPYVRLLDTNGVEFCFMAFSNATFWSTGGTREASRAIRALPQHFWIACGYAFHRDSMYAHAQGGPYETIINAANGRVIHRGRLRCVHDCTLQIDQHTGVMHVGDTLHARLADTGYAFNFELYEDATGKLLRHGTNINEIVLSPKLPDSYLLVCSAGAGSGIFWREFRRITVLPKLELTDDLAHLGRLVVNDSIACGLSNDVHILVDGRIDFALGDEFVSDRLPSSKPTNLWNGTGRVIAYDRGYFAYTIGMHLKRGQPYVLEVQYPEDVPRTMALVIGHGAYAPGIHTGHTLGQPEPRFFSEQIMFPLSKSIEKAHFIVWPGEREARNGLLVGFADPGARNAPFSHKPLVLTITLYNMLTIARPRIHASFPPGLQRYAWTESEQADASEHARYIPHLNSVLYGLNALAPTVLPWNNRDDELTGTPAPSPRYARYVRRMVNDTEYETTQREDPRHHYNYLAEYAGCARQYNLAVFPVLEYGGSDLLPPEARAVASNGLPYAPVRRTITSRDVYDSVDVCHTAVAADAEAFISNMLAGLNNDQKSVLRPLIIRRQAEFLSTAYNDSTLQRFVRETALNPPAAEPAALRQWMLASCHDAYRRWYQSNLLAFAAGLQQSYARQTMAADGPALYYHWRHSGMPFEGLYFQTEERWTDHWIRVRSAPVEGFPLPAITPDALLKAVGSWTSTEEGFFTSLLPVSGLAPVFPAYGTRAASTPAYAELFCSGAACAVKIAPTLLSPARVYRRNRPPLYAGTTLYHSREHIMYDALLAFVNYNPRFLAFDQSHPPCFPAAEFARRFILNFLALPALPLTSVPHAGQEYLYAGMAQHGSHTYIALANLDFMPHDVRVELPLPRATQLMPLTGPPEPVPFFVSDRGISFTQKLAPLELRSLRVDE